MDNFIDLLKSLGQRTALSLLLPGIIVAWLLLPAVNELVSQPPIRDRVIIRVDKHQARYLG